MKARFAMQRVKRSGLFIRAKSISRKSSRQPRHIEIQIAGDQHGNLVHLGERECSVQRRHQKIIEECPSPLVAANPKMRAEMGEAALRIARAAGYYNLGTVEFLAEDNGSFYFLEVNTRLQVEHPVTELVTGLDLVHLQLRIAAGEALPFAQQDVSWRGWAMECRVCAEDPEQNFFPSPGKIEQLREPAGPGIRLDSGVYPGWTVPLEYDPLLAKLVAWAPDRHTAIQRLLRALEEYAIVGVETNLRFFSEILNDGEFREGRLNTRFIADFFKRRQPAEARPETALVAALAAAAHSRNGHPRNGHGESRSEPPETSRWLAEGRNERLR